MPKRNTIEKAVTDAFEQKKRRKEEIDHDIRLLAQRVKEKREKALVLILERIVG